MKPPETFEVDGQERQDGLIYPKVERISSDSYSKSEIDSKFETILVKTNGSFKLIESRLDKVEKEISYIRKEIKNQFTSMKYWIAGAIATLFIGFGALYYAGISNVISSFSAGISISEQQKSKPTQEQTQPIIINIPSQKK